MVMEFIEGSALSKLSTEMSKRGVVPGSIESQLFGKKLLSALTDAYASMIFGSGIIHGDPHPVGNNKLSFTYQYRFSPIIFYLLFTG